MVRLLFVLLRACLPRNSPLTNLFWVQPQQSLERQPGNRGTAMVAEEVTYYTLSDLHGFCMSK